ncbi:type II toxin-antitoxin system HipA family toxin [Glutamicibacter sp. X7]
MSRGLQDLKKVQRADVYKQAQLAGHLTRLADGSVVFTYTEQYLQESPVPVATSLPLSDQAYAGPGGGLPAFFSGLLPEGHRLTMVRNVAKTSMADELTLLLVVGADTPGDVRILPAGDDLTAPPAVVDFSDGDELDFTQLATSLDRHAIPGVQEKISATMLTTPLALDGDAYLLKLDPRDYPHLVSNEELHLRAARQLKLPLVDFRKVHDSHQVEGLLIKRFDRALPMAGASPVRYALEDGMQVLDLPPSMKYSVATEEVVRALADKCKAPLLAKRNLYLQFLFAWLTGNGDLHGKNVSILADKDHRFSIAPIYDVPCTLLYGDDTMALSIGGKHKNLKQKHWTEFAHELGLTPKATESANRLALRAAEHVDLAMLPFSGSPLRGTQRELRFRRLEISAT